MQLAHIASRLYGTPLLIARPKLDVILSVLGSRIDWPDSATSPALLPTSAASLTSPMVTGAARIAVIPVHGTLVRRSLGVEAASGLTSYADIAVAMDAAQADPLIDAVLLDVDSPGGEAGGVFDLAQRVRDLNAIKPVWAVAADSAFSAAYAIACAASRIYVTQTAGVGSIGVIAMHVDQSVRDAQEGYRYTAITAGDHKNDLSPHEPLDKDASIRLQAEVDRLYGLFVAHVAAMRGLEPRFIRSTQAGLYFGPEAVAAGLADVQGNLDSALADLAEHLTARRMRSVPGSSFSLSIPHSPPNPKEITMSEQARAAAPEVPADHPNQTSGSTPEPKNRDVPGHVSDEDADVVADADREVDDAAEVVKASAPPQAVRTLATNALHMGAQVDHRAESRAESHAESLAIAELCQLAGQPERIVGFLTAGVTAQQVRRALLETRAQSADITSAIHPDAAFKASTPDQGLLMAAVKKLN